MGKHIGQMIKELRLRKGWTVRKLAELVHKTPAYVSLIENKKRELKTPLLEAFAKALGVSPAYFLQEHPGAETKAEDVLRMLLRDLEEIAERYAPEGYVRFGRARRIPVISYTAAGDPVEYEDMFPVGCADEYVDCFAEVSDEHAFALRIRGDSMEPWLKDDDIVIVCPSWPVKEGKPVVAKVRDGEITCKIYNRSGGKVVLRAVNPEHAPLVVDEKEIVWIYPVGKAVCNVY